MILIRVYMHMCRYTHVDKCTVRSCKVGLPREPTFQFRGCNAKNRRSDWSMWQENIKSIIPTELVSWPVSHANFPTPHSTRARVLCVHSTGAHVHIYVLCTYMCTDINLEYTSLHTGCFKDYSTRENCGLSKRKGTKRIFNRSFLLSFWTIDISTAIRTKLHM